MKQSIPLLALLCASCSFDLPPPSWNLRDAARTDVRADVVSMMGEVGTDALDVQPTDVTVDERIDVASEPPTIDVQDVVPPMDAEASVTMEASMDDVVLDESIDALDAAPDASDGMMGETVFVEGGEAGGDAGSDAGSDAVDAPVSEGGDPRQPLRELAAGNGFTCARSAGALVYCWGANEVGQLGDNTLAATKSRPTQVLGLRDVTQLSAGGRHVCALDGEGALLCWGANDRGQLGDGTRTNRPLPTRVMGLRTVIRVAAGSNHTCAVQSDGAVYCWGANDRGQLAAAGTADVLMPTMVSDLRMATDVRAGTAHTCAIARGAGACMGATETARVYCWGSNDRGQLGVGDTMERRVATLVTPARDVCDPPGGLSLGNAHTCMQQGTVVSCWGANNRGQLADGAMLDQNAPVRTRFPSLLAASDMRLGGAFTCLRFVAAGVAAVRCVGANTAGQLGNGTGTDSLELVAPTGVFEPTALSAGNDHGCAIDATSQAWCWGRNDRGQLGDGTMMDRLVPVRVVY